MRGRGVWFLSESGDWLCGTVESNCADLGGDAVVEVHVDRRQSFSASGSGDSDSECSDSGRGGLDGEVKQVKLGELLDRNEWDNPPEDLVQLVHLHEPAILQVLYERFCKADIYSWCGPILLAMNPFERLPLYRKSVLEMYRKKAQEQQGGEVAPHVYAVAAASYQCLIDKTGTEYGDQDQSILISGESGAGKTESTKIVMQYLATVARSPADDGREVDEELHVSEYLGGEDKDSTGGKSEPEKEINVKDYSIEQQVLESNPILEAFGNARTIRNDNSSRFGKFIQMQFDSGGFLVGAMIKTYLLEKVRIIQQGEGERSYHVFYQMIYGGSSEEKEQWMIEAGDEPSDFQILNSGGCYDRRDGVDDAEQLHITKRAMSIMGLTEVEQGAVFTLVAAILHLGNIDFVENDSGSKLDTDNEESRKALAGLCGLLGVQEETVANSFCWKTLNARGETMKVPLSPDLAADTRDALAKSAYSRAFDWLVKRVNDCIQPKKKVKRFIGVLDIFGFEIFKHNSFEQLCINYANERLQQQFNDFVFKHEQAIYASEKINWSFIDFPSNATTVELVDGGVSSNSGMGILALLDDECKVPQGNDKGFARKLYENCENRERFSVSKSQRVRGEFVVQHYAGDVTYDTEGFCEKNRDTLREEAIDLMKSSSSSFVRELFDDDGKKKDGSAKSRRTSKKDTADANRKSTGRSAGASSVGAEFKKQLASLIEIISGTAPHYIRCIKPNDQARAKLVNRQRVVGQLRCGGVLEAVRVARAGFPIRMPHRVFVERYGRLVGSSALTTTFSHVPKASLLKKGNDILMQVPHTKAQALERTVARSMAKDIVHILTENDELGEFEIDGLSQVGRTRVFLRKHGHDLFERWLLRWKLKAASIVTSRILGMHIRQKYVGQRAAARKMQAVIRGRFSRVRVLKIRQDRSCLKLQAWGRGRIHFVAYKRITSAIVTIQKFERGRKDRKVAHERRIIRARLRLQCWARGYKHRRNFHQQRSSTIALQALARRMLAKSAVVELRRKARDLSHVIEERDRLREQLRQLSTSGGSVSHSTNVGAVVTGQTSVVSEEIRRKSIVIAAAAYVTTTLWQNLDAYSKSRVDNFFAKKEQFNAAEKSSSESAIGAGFVDSGIVDDDKVTADWYKETFGKELEHLDNISLTPTKAKPDTTRICEAEDLVSRSNIDDELSKKRRSIETKRAELEELNKKEQEVLLLPSPKSPNLDQLESLHEELEQLRTQAHETSEKASLAHAELTSKESEILLLKKSENELKAELTKAKEFLGQQMELKNCAAIKQGELELQIRAFEEENDKLQKQCQTLEAEKGSIEVELETFRNTQESNRSMARSAAVIELENELQLSHQEADELRKQVLHAKNEVERISKEAEITKSALDEIRESAADKFQELEASVSKERREKRRSVQMAQARVVIDRRSRRVAQNVISVWAAYTREIRELRKRTYCAKQLFENRRIGLSFRRWALASKRARRNSEVLLNRKLKGEIIAKRLVFKDWLKHTRRTLHVEAIAESLGRRDAYSRCLRVFRSWKEWVSIRFQERLLFDKATRAFELGVLGRVVRAWRAYKTQSVRLDMLLEFSLQKKEQLLKKTVLFAWSRGCRSSHNTEMPSSATATHAPHDLELVATLMKRMEKQDERIAELLRSQTKRSEELAQMTPKDIAGRRVGGMTEGIPRRSYQAEIFQLHSSDEEEDSFYPSYSSHTPPPYPVANKKGNTIHRSNSEQELVHHAPPYTADTSVVDVFRTKRNSHGSMSNMLVRAYSSPGIAAIEDPGTDMILRDAGITEVDRDGTLVIEDAPQADMETLLVTAKSLSIPPVILAAQHGVFDVLQQLLEEGANPNEEDFRKHKTALHAAINALQWDGDGSERMVELLLEKGADVNARNNVGNTPLMEAALKGDEALEICRTLLRHGALNNPKQEGANEFGQTPLHAAIRTNAIRTMHLLLENGASLVRGDAQGQTAIHHAARLCNVAALQNLLCFKALGDGVAVGSPKKSKKSVEIKGLQDANGNTALHLVCSSTSPDISKAIFTLLENGFNANVRNKAGQTPLHILCSNKYTTAESLSRFKEAKVKFYLQDRCGNTALHAACHLDIRDIACTLVSMGAELYIPNDANDTPLSLVPQGFAVKLLKAVNKPPDEVLMKRFHAVATKCMACTNDFSYFRDRHACHHCGRICCSKCTQKKYPILKFQKIDKVTVCDHCYGVLTLPTSPSGSPFAQEF